jgi:putative lipoprotein
MNNAQRLLMGLLLCLLLALPALGQDKWSGYDKKQHLAMGLVIGTVGTAAAESKALGFGAGCLAGLAKELLDNRSGGTGFSAKDLTVTCAGALLGTVVGGWLIEAGRREIRASRSF